MNIDKIPLGYNPPYDFNVIVEIPQGGFPVKYEMDKASGAMYVDRFLNTSMSYPANYGFIPHTLSTDGDPCDVLVLTQSPVVSGAVIRARPIGALVMTDEAGADDKIIAVPIDQLSPYYGWVQSPEDLPPVQRDQVAHFFQHYKDLEKDKWVAGLHWAGYEAALALVVEGIKRGPYANKIKLPAIEEFARPKEEKAPKADKLAVSEAKKADKTKQHKASAKPKTGRAK